MCVVLVGPLRRFGEKREAFAFQLAAQGRMPVKRQSADRERNEGHPAEKPANR